MSLPLNQVRARAMISLKERAEYFSYEDLEGIEVIDGTNIAQIKDYLTNDLRHPLFYLGVKGLGKTFTIMKALNEIIAEREDLVPSMFIFEARGRIELMDPLHLASKEKWDNRLGFFVKDKTLEEIIDGSDIVVIDDLHYMCEAISDGHLDRGSLLELLRSLLKYVNKGKKIILVSEDPLNTYAEKLQWEELESLLPYFGMIPILGFNPTAERRKKVRALRSKVNYMSFKEVLPISEDSFQELPDIYGVSVPTLIVSLIHLISPRPRAFVRFCNLFETREISSQDVKDFVQDLLLQSRQLRPPILSKGEYNNYLEQLQKPIYSLKIPPSSYMKLMRKSLQSYKDNFETIHECCIQTASIIGDIVRDITCLKSSEGADICPLEEGITLHPQVVNRVIRKEKVIPTTEVLETTYNYETAMKWYNESQNSCPRGFLNGAERKGAFISFQYWEGDTLKRVRSTDFPDPTSMKELYRARICEETVKTQIYDEIVEEETIEEVVPCPFEDRELCRETWPVLKYLKNLTIYNEKVVIEKPCTISTHILKNWRWWKWEEKPYSTWNSDPISRIRWAEKNVLDQLVTMKIEEYLTNLHYSKRDRGNMKRLITNYYRDPLLSRWLREVIDNWDEYVKLTPSYLRSLSSMEAGYFTTEPFEFVLTPLLRDPPTATQIEDVLNSPFFKEKRRKAKEYERKYYEENRDRVRVYNWVNSVLSKKYGLLPSMQPRRLGSVKCPVCGEDAEGYLQRVIFFEDGREKLPEVETVRGENTPKGLYATIFRHPDVRKQGERYHVKLRRVVS